LYGAVGKHIPGAKARVVVGSNAWAEAQAYLRSKSGGRVSANVLLGRGGAGGLRAPPMRGEALRMNGPPGFVGGLPTISSTVTLLARFMGWSTSQPLLTAMG